MTLYWRYGLVAAAVAVSASAAQAQQHALDRGSIQVAGTASFTSVGSDGDDDRLTTITANPRLGYLFAEWFAIGADLTLNYSKFSGNTSSRSIGIGPSLTYYFGRASDNVHPYVSARASFASIHVETPLSDQDGTRRSGSAAAGILVMLSRSIGVTTELFYLIEKIEAGTQDAELNTVGLAVGVAAFVF